MDEGQVVQSAMHVRKADVAKFIADYKEIPAARVGEVSVDPLLYEGDTVMFLVNYGEGWDLISADKRAPMILILSETGSATVADLYDNPGKEIRMKTMARAIAALRNDPQAKFFLASRDATDEPEEYISMWAAVAPEGIVFPSIETRAGEVWTCIGVEKTASQITQQQTHLLKTKWDQGSPWNYYCPFITSNDPASGQCFTGCVPVAVGQLLHYLHSKLGVPQKTYGEVSARETSLNGSSLYLTAANLNIDEASYGSHWDAMALSGTASDYGSAGTKYASALMVYLGYRLGAAYKKTSTGVKVDDIDTAISSLLSDYFSISCRSKIGKFDWQILPDNIVERKIPLLIVGSGHQPSLDNKLVSHTYVIDGYKEEYVTYKYTYIQSNTMPPQFKYTNKWVFEDYIQINWGASGKYDNAWHTKIVEWQVGTGDNILNFSYDGIQACFYDFSVK
ncbi:MAG: C10 family peptidase [Alistipes sp.]|nr:C10 family peptidase [Alistipes sp.]